MHEPASKSPACALSGLPQLSVRCAVLTVSDTRDLTTDRGGQRVLKHLSAAGHQIVTREIVADDVEQIRAQITRARAADVQVVLLTGGTGIAPRDVTCEAIEPLFTKSLPGYGELLRMLSYEQIGAAALLSRASGGLIERLVVLAMPGSVKAVDLAMEKIIVPQLSHLVREANK